MNNILYILISLLIITVSTGLMYLYLTYRHKETKKLKDFFTVVPNKKYLIFSVVMLIVSLLVYLYSYFTMDEVTLKPFVNAEVTLWLMALGYIDWKEKIIPNEMVLTGICFWGILSIIDIFIAHSPWKQVLLFSIVGALVWGGILFIIALIVKSALGMGDVKMFFVIGLLYGLSDTYSILFFSIFIMAVMSIVLLLAKKVTRKTAIPMAPFVVFGFLIKVLLGN